MPRTRSLRCLVSAALVFAPAMAHAEPLEPRVLIMKVQGDVPEDLGPLRTDVRRALADGAGTATASVIEGRATFDESAVIAGCVPDDPGCGDDVIQALGVDQLLIARLAWRGDHGEVTVLALTLEGQPVSRSFQVSVTHRDADLDAIRIAVPSMLGWKPRPLAAPKPESTPAVERRFVRESASSVPPALVIGGGALVVAGAISWGLAARRQGEIDDAPTSTPAEVEALADLEDRAARTATIGNVLMFGGALVAAVGGAWWWHDHRSRSTVEVSAGPGVARVSFGGTF